MPDSEPLVLFRLRRAPAGLRRPALEEFARLLRARVAGGREFQCLVTDDRELQRLNRQFLGKDYPTDVLSFPAGRTVRQGKPTPRLLGELAISAKRAAEQAREFGSRLAEWTGREVRLWDERLTTVEAQRVLKSSGISTAKRARAVDQLSAQILLDSFLNLETLD